MARKEGVKRLSIAAAVVTPVLAFVAIGFYTQVKDVWSIVIFSLLCGVFAWGLVRLSAWVIDGFVRTSSEEKTQTAKSTAAR